MNNIPTLTDALHHSLCPPCVFQDESAGSLSTGSGLDLDEGEEEGALGADLQDDENLQPGSDDDF